MDREKALQTRAGKSDYSQQSRLPEIHGFLGASDSYRLPGHLSSLALRTRSIGLTWELSPGFKKDERRQTTIYSPDGCHSVEQQLNQHLLGE